MNISYDEAMRRLTSPNNIADLAIKSRSGIEYRPSGKDGKARQVNLPEPVRDTIAQLAHEASSVNKKSGAHQKIAEAFGVSCQTVTAAMSGKVGGLPANTDRSEKRLNRELEIKDLALTKLMKSLNLISEEKLEDLDASKLAGVASQMSKVAQNLTPQVSNEQQVKLIVYSPVMSQVKDYKVIDVEDQDR